MLKGPLAVLQEPVPAVKTLGAGAAAGLVGGLVFGTAMGALGALPMAGLFPGAEGALVGLIVHVIVSTLLGVIYGLFAWRLPARWRAAAAAGTVYGVVRWVFGALIFTPLMLGMGEKVFAFNGMQWVSLVGYLMYGLTTGLLYMVFGQDTE